MGANSEEARLVDRIQATAFFQAREAGASFITKKWVADRLKRSESWIKRNCEKNPMECFADFSKCGTPENLSQESKAIISEGVALQRKSCRELAKEILRQREKKHGATEVLALSWESDFF